MTILRRVGIAQTKLRNTIGIIGVEADTDQQLIHVKFAKQWNRLELPKVVPEIHKLHKNIKWSKSYIDVLVGSHIITSLRKAGLPLNLISVQRDIKDLAVMRGAKKMDENEMVNWTLKMLQVGRIHTPDTPTVLMQEYLTQMSIYSEHTTEAGHMAHYAPGKELDCLPKAAMLVFFSLRHHLSDSSSGYVATHSVPTGRNRGYGEYTPYGSALTGTQVATEPAIVIEPQQPDGW